MGEEVLLLGPNRSSVGVFTPASDVDGKPSELAAICITAGLLHHVGPHRLHVLLARELSKRGVATLRFDLSGIGDSAVRIDDVPAPEVPVREINDAIAELESRGIKRVVLFGICSGAVHAAKAAITNSKVAGVILVNPGADDGNVEAQPQLAAQIYLKHSVRNLKSWKNLLTGKIKYRQLITALAQTVVNRIKGAGKKVFSMEEELQKGLQPFMERGVSMLMVLSDRHAQLYELNRNAYERLQSTSFETLVYVDSDHLFCTLAVQRELIGRICQWSCALMDEKA